MTLSILAAPQAPCRQGRWPARSSGLAHVRGEGSRLLANVFSVRRLHLAGLPRHSATLTFNPRSPQTYEEASATDAWKQTPEMPTKGS
jgi:hypothetical protein